MDVLRDLYGKQQEEEPETGFEKANRLTAEKNTRVILGLDPTMEEFAQLGADHLLIKYKKIIDETESYILGIKLNLAFYENHTATRNVMMKLMAYAKGKGLLTIMDAKRGDILDTQKHWAHADLENFKPDIVTLHSYSGQDAVQPYLDKDPQVCAMIMGAMSNPSSQLQNLSSDGLKVYQHVALDAHKWGQGRVGLVVGATQGKALEYIRMVEAEYGYDPLLVLAPGLGKQGGKPFADKNAIFPISSGLTQEKYLQGRTPAEAAKQWRDDINAEVEKAQEQKTLTEHVVDGLITDGYIQTFDEPKVLAKGREKLKKLDITLPTDKEQLVEAVRDAINKGILTGIPENEIAVPGGDVTRVFANIRDIGGMADRDIPRFIAHLDAKKIRDVEKAENIKFDAVNIVPHGKLATGYLTADYLNLPNIVLRDSDKPGHDRAVGGLRKLAPDARIATLEDVATSGGSTIKNIELLRATAKEMGIDISAQDAFVFLRRIEEDNIANCAAHGIKLHHQIDFDYMKHLLLKSPAVAPEFKDLIR